MANFGKGSLREEMTAVVSLAWPTCGSNVLLFSFQFVNMLGSGCMGTDALAAVALANSYFNIITYFFLGAASAQDTMVAQSFGRGKTAECQRWLLRSFAVFAAACVPLCLFLVLAGPLFRLCHFSEEMVGPAESYLWRLLPGTPCFVFFVLLQKYQQAMNVMVPSLSVLTICSLINMALTTWAVGTGDVASLASSLSIVRAMLFLLMTLVLLPTSPEWLQSFRGSGEPLLELWEMAKLKKFLQLAFSGAFMTGLEASAFEFTVLAAASLGKTAVNAHNILMQLISLFYLTVPLGISIAATIRVGNVLGGGDGSRARLSAWLCIGLGSSFMSFSAVGLWVFRNVLGRTFTSDTAVVKLVAAVAPVAACFQAIDGFQGVCGGVLRAMGQQAFLAKAIFVAFFVLGIPLGFWMCFQLQWGIFGLWMGLAVGLGGMALSFGWRIFLQLDWDQEATQASRTPQDTKFPLLP